MEVIRLQAGCKGGGVGGIGGRRGRGAHSQGSRFISWQFYGLAAGGSRERFDVRQLYRLRPTRLRNEHVGQETHAGQFAPGKLHMVCFVLSGWPAG